MLAAERHDAILSLLSDEGRVLASDLAPRLGVSLDTVRRDLDGLATMGALRRVHGGALPTTSSPARFVDRRDIDVAAKRAIGAAAVDLVRPGAVVLLGGGTTVLELARALPDGLEAAFVTSAPDVAVALLDRGALEVVLLGGPVNADTRTVTGAEAAQTLHTLRADLCVLGACSLHTEAGVTVLDRAEAALQRTMLERAARTAVLADASKLGSAGPYVVGPAGAVDVVVTDRCAPAAELAELVGLGIEVIRA